MTAPIRFGILGAARIVPKALLHPVRKVEGTAIAAIAARDPSRAQRFAARHQIPRVHRSYQALIDDPEIEAVYNPLPNSLHAEWTIRALRAGKHVLCEKRMAANAGEAEQMAAAAAESGKVLTEAFHYRYHPVAERMKAIVESGEIGGVRHIETYVCIPLVRLRDIRYSFALAGGATMDTGCYAIHMARFLAGAEPEVVAAQARLMSPQVDRYMEAKLRFADGRTARVVCSLLSRTLLRVKAIVYGERGVMRVYNPIAPMYFHRIVIQTPNGKQVEKLPGDSTYTYQLRAFVDAVRTGAPLPTNPADAIANMRVIDAVYDHAGLSRRGVP